MTVICYGDSNTYGYDPRSYFGDRYSAEFRWVDILQSKTGWEVCNKGMNGRTIPTKETYISGSFDLLIIMLGTNDLLQMESPVDIAKKMEMLLKNANVDLEKIILVAPPKMQLGAWVESQELVDNSAVLSKYYREIALKLGIRFLDAGEWGIPLAFDGVHFTEEGHRIFGNEMVKQLI